MLIEFKHEGTENMCVARLVAKRVLVGAVVLVVVIGGLIIE